MTRNQEHAAWFFGSLIFFFLLFAVDWGHIIRFLLLLALGPN